MDIKRKSVSHSVVTGLQNGPQCSLFPCIHTPMLSHTEDGRQTIKFTNFPMCKCTTESLGT